MTTETAAGGRTGGLEQTAKGLVAEVGDSAEQQADSLMTNAGTTVHEVAGVVRRAGDELRGGQPQIARFTTMAADRMEDVASYLDGHQPRELLDEAQRYARQQPLLVVAGGMALGLALGRLLRTAGPAGAGQGDDDWYREGLRRSDRSPQGGSSVGYRSAGSGTYQGNGPSSLTGTVATATDPLADRDRGS